MSCRRLNTKGRGLSRPPLPYSRKSAVAFSIFGPIILFFMYKPICREVLFRIIVPLTQDALSVQTVCENFLANFFNMGSTPIHRCAHQFVGEVMFPNPFQSGQQEIVYAGPVNEELARILSYSPHIRASRNSFYFKGSYKKFPLIFEDALVLFLNSSRTIL